MSTASIVSAELRALANKDIAQSRTWFFKTGKGEYGYGDVFLGIEVPVIREVAKRHQGLALDHIKKLAASKYHEERFIALAIIVFQFKKAKVAGSKKQLFDTYLELLKANRVNSWDLVDASAPYLGVYLLDFAGAPALFAKLAKSSNLWEQRASIMFTWAHIRAGQLKVSTKQVELFLDHPHDLIHKAAGWMLREVGKRDLKLLRSFLDAHAAIMPRVMLRYAIEKMTETERAKWLGKAKS